MYDAAKQMIIEHIFKKLLYPIMPNTPQAKIFISHRSTDKAVADALCDLIQSSFRLQSHDIICTSVDAHGIENGKLSYHELKQQLVNANLVIYLLSEAFCQSEDCHYEIAWGFDLKTGFYYHLDGVASSCKPRCVCHKSMYNLDEAGLTELKLRLFSVLREDYDERIWSHKSRLVLNVKDVKKICEKSTSEITVNESSNRESLTDYITSCNQSVCVKVNDEFDELDDCIARIGIWAFLPKCKAKLLIEEQRCRLVDRNVAAIYMKKDIMIPENGISLKKGKVYPMPCYILSYFLRNDVAVWVNSVNDIDA